MTAVTVLPSTVVRLPGDFDAKKAKTAEVVERFNKVHDVAQKGTALLLAVYKQGGELLAELEKRFKGSGQWTAIRKGEVDLPDQPGVRLNISNGTYDLYTTVAKNWNKLDGVDIPVREVRSYLASLNAIENKSEDKPTTLPTVEELEKSVESTVVSVAATAKLPLYLDQAPKVAKTLTQLYKDWSSFVEIPDDADDKKEAELHNGWKTFLRSLLADDGVSKVVTDWQAKLDAAKAAAKAAKKAAKKAAAGSVKKKRTPTTAAALRERLAKLEAKEKAEAEAKAKADQK